MLFHNWSSFMTLLRFLGKILVLLLWFFLKSLKQTWIVYHQHLHHQCFFNCRANSTCWIAFRSASNFLVCLNQLLLIYNDFWFWHLDLNNKQTNSLLTPTKLDSRKYLYLFVIFLFSFFVLYSLEYTDLSSSLLWSFASFWLSFADKVTTGSYNFVSVLVTIIS